MSDKISKSERKRQLAGKSSRSQYTESQKRNIAAITKQPVKPTVKPLPPASVSTSRYIPGSETKGKPISKPKKPSKNTEFYEQHTETIEMIPGRGYTGEQVINRSEGITKSQIQEIQSYPTGTRFKPTDKQTYEVIIPEKEQFSYTKTELKQFEKLPPGISQIQKFRFGVESSINALFSPVTNRFGQDKTAGLIKGTQMITTGGLGVGLDILTGRNAEKTYRKTSKYSPQYIVSPLDVVMEPFGLAPKGATDILKENPAFTAGGVFGEIGQGYVIGAGASKITKSIIKPGVKAGVRGGSKVFKTFTKVFPDEKIITGSTRKIGQTGFGKNLYRWGVKGYEPVSRLSSGGAVKTSEKILKGDVASTRVVSRELLEGGGKRIERVFLSPSEASKASKLMQSRLGSRMSLNFPKSPDIAQSYLKTTKIKGMLNKRLVTSEKAFYTTWNKPLGVSSDEFIKKGLVVGGKKQSGFFKAGPSEILQDVDHVSRMSYTTSFKPYEARFRIDDIYDVGSVGYEQTKMIGGVYEKRMVQPVSAIRGTRATKAGFFTGPSTDDPMKAWAKQAEKSRINWYKKQQGFFGNTRGTQTLIPKLESPLSVKPSVSSSSRLGLIKQFQSPGIPVNIPIGPASAIGFLEGKSVVNLLPSTTGLRKRQKQRSISLMTDSQKDLFIDVSPDTMIKRKPDTVTIPVVIQESETDSIQEQSFIKTTKQQQKQEVIPLMKMKTGASYYPTTSVIKPYTMPLSGILPKSGGGGYGIRGFAGKKLSKKYYYREYDIPSLKELFGRISL